jgi:dTMP kinase
VDDIHLSHLCGSALCGWRATVDFIHPMVLSVSKPLFITFEGGEGAGKSTQLKRLATSLRAQHHDCIATREPGGAPGAEALRTLLLSPGHDWAPEAETLLHFAARAEHIAKTISPALAAGSHVLCDRFFDSTRAYQGFGQGANMATIATLIGMLPLKPDLTLILDVSPAIARERLMARDIAADRYERMGEAFHARVAAGFQHIAAAEPDRCVLIDANPDADTVAAAILTVVTSRLS